MKIRYDLTLVCAAFVLQIACQSTAPAPRPAARPMLLQPPPPATVQPEPDATPPHAAYSPPRPFPKVQSLTLDNGLAVPT